MCGGFRTILTGMRLIFMMATLLIISSLIFNGHSSGLEGSDDVSGQLRAPIEKAENVSQVIEDAATLQRQALEKQIQQ
jgi:hypothetical protein